jgi:hypothetical protein
MLNVERKRPATGGHGDSVEVHRSEASTMQEEIICTFVSGRQIPEYGLFVLHS